MWRGTGGAGVRGERGWEVNRRREKTGQRDSQGGGRGEIGKHTTLHNILQSKIRKDEGANKKKGGTAGTRVWEKGSLNPSSVHPPPPGIVGVYCTFCCTTHGFNGIVISDIIRIAEICWFILVDWEAILVSTTETLSGASTSTFRAAMISGSLM